MDEPFALAVFALIPNDQGEFLLKRRTDLDIWDLPGGKADPEDFAADEPYDIACLRREVHEETGCEVEIGETVGLYQTGALTSSTQSVSKTLLCRLVGEHLSLNDEAQEFGWFAPGKLPTNVFLTHAAMIDDFPIWRDILHPMGRCVSADLRHLIDLQRNA